MKKLLMGLAVIGLAVAVLVTTGVVYAQRPTPPAPQAGSDSWGPWAGKMGGRGMMPHRAGEEGPLHDAMIAAFAEKLGLSASELEARLEQGETMAQIASEKGLTVEEFSTWMQAARSQAIAQAVKDGVLTQEQADQMLQRGAAPGWRMGRGAGRMGGGNFGNCPMYNSAPAQ